MPSTFRMFFRAVVGLACLYVTLSFQARQQVIHTRSFSPFQLAAVEKDIATSISNAMPDMSSQVDGLKAVVTSAGSVAADTLKDSTATALKTVTENMPSSKAEVAGLAQDLINGLPDQEEVSVLVNRFNENLGIETAKTFKDFAERFPASAGGTLRDFSVQFPDKFKLLTTTLRSAGDGGAAHSIAAGDSSRLPLDLGLFPQIIDSTLSPTIQHYLSEPKFWAGLSVLVLLSDVLQTSAAEAAQNRQYADDYQEMAAQLRSAEQSNDAVKALREDLVALSKQLEDAKAEVAAFKKKEEFDSIGASTAAPTGGGGVKAASSSSSSSGGSVARDLEIQRLKDELAAEKKKKKAAPAAKKQAAAKDEAASSSSSSSNNKVPKEFVERERALVEAVKSFLVQEEYLAAGLANMLMASSAPAELRKLSSGDGKGGGKKKQKTAAGSSSSSSNKDGEASAKLAIVEKEMVAMSKQVSALRAENGKLLKQMQTQTEKAKGTQGGSKQQQQQQQDDKDAYVKQLAAEAEGLKKQLLSSDERLMDLQQDMQKKVDSAKLMAKELNSQLRESQAAHKAATAATAAAEKKVAAAAVAVPAVKKAAVPAVKKAAAPVVKKGAAPAAKKATARKTALLGMTPAAVKKLTKLQLQADAAALGASVGDLEGLTKPQVLDIVTALLSA